MLVMFTLSVFFLFFFFAFESMLTRLAFDDYIFL